MCRSANHNALKLYFLPLEKISLAIFFFLKIYNYFFNNRFNVNLFYTKICAIKFSIIFSIFLSILHPIFLCQIGMTRCGVNWSVIWLHRMAIFHELSIRFEKFKLLVVQYHKRLKNDAILNLSNKFKIFLLQCY